MKKRAPPFFVAGLSARTNNVIENTSESRIARIWERFVTDGQTGDEIYAVYTEYESDHTGDYTFVLGHKVESVDGLPEGVKGVSIPGGEYAVLTSDIGPVTQVVPELWRKIWSLTPDELQGTRAYLTDFELYGQRAANPHSAQVDIYLSLTGSNLPST
jgi:predicted transcriptional regulator YdeE